MPLSVCTIITLLVGFGICLFPFLCKMITALDDDDSGCPATENSSLKRSRDEVEGDLSSSPSTKTEKKVDERELNQPPESPEPPVDMNAEAEAIYAAIERIMCQEMAFEIHRDIRTGILNTEALYAERPRSVSEAASGAAAGGTSKRRAGFDIYGRVPPKEPVSHLTCGVCGRLVSALRYAPHLDKCMMGNGRSRNRVTDYGGGGATAGGGGGSGGGSGGIGGTGSTYATGGGFGELAGSHGATGKTRAPPARATTAASRKKAQKKQPPPLRLLIKLNNGVPVQTYQKTLVLEPPVPAIRATTPENGVRNGQEGDGNGAPLTGG
ncbi:unnamed protein product [Phaeothamnion confervicola]